MDVFELVVAGESAVAGAGEALIVANIVFANVMVIELQYKFR